MRVLLSRVLRSSRTAWFLVALTLPGFGIAAADVVLTFGWLRLALVVVPPVMIVTELRGRALERQNRKLTTMVGHVLGALHVERMRRGQMADVPIPMSKN